MVREFMKSIGIEPRRVYQSLSAASLRAALREQRLDGLANQLRDVVPDLIRQYSYDIEPEEYARYWEIKIRGMHAFQVKMALDALALIDAKSATVADIGDSSGTHGAYLKALAEPGTIKRFISVNLDSVAVEKIRERGGEAVLCRAEELDHQAISPDLYLSFETLEHLTDPVRFLHELSAKGQGRFIVLTVPYRRDSRFGGTLMRMPLDKMPKQLTAEQVHMFELNPDDWRLLALFAGWKTVALRVYKQYPAAHPMRLTAPMWRKFDFEGFLGMILEKDTAMASRYRDW